MGNCPPGATAAAGTNAANANDDPWYSFIIARPRSAASTMVFLQTSYRCLAARRAHLVTTDWTTSSFTFLVVLSFVLLSFSQPFKFETLKLDF